MKEVRKYAGCFVCGDKNVHGLKARFFYDGDTAFTQVTISRAYEGYRDISHGGIITCLLDEVMIKAILAKDIFAVTAEMTVRFRKPIRSGVKLRFIGRITGNRGRVFITEGEARGADGQVYAEATGKYIRADAALEQQLMKSID
ncbi:MAG: PaaI family thioesterase [candidate division Zixibacteria bacterium]|nr:PaaI family thioesterase [candidate division Zixibacteria bacterium]